MTDPIRRARGPQPAAARVRGCAVGVAVAGLSLVLAACGSQLDPQEVAGLNRTAGGSIPVSGSVDGGSAEGGIGTEDGGVSTDPGGAGSAPETGTGGESTSTDSGAGGPAAPGPDGGSTTSEGPAPQTGGNAPDGGSKAGSCDGFDNNQPGVTASTITLANVSDISGPVPGIFESARQGARAYAAYFNSTQKVCGHSIKMLELDSRADAGADQQAFARACAETFGAIGSMSAFDSGGAATTEKCGLPDVRSTPVNPERTSCSTCFGAQSLTPGLVPSAMPKFMMKLNRDATQHAALLYINAGAAPVNANSFKSAWETVGWKIDYFQPIDVSEFNFAPYVQQMKDRGIKMVYYLGPLQNTVKLQQAMSSQGYTPDIYLQDSTIYDPTYIKQAGDLAKGVYVYTNIALFDDTSNPEMRLYRAWLEQVNPGASPNFYGLYAWSAARLFLEKSIELGGKLTRASLIKQLKGVRSWTSGGLHSPQDPGGKTTGKCQAVIQYTGSTWKQVSPGDYLCDALVNTGLGN